VELEVRRESIHDGAYRRFNKEGMVFGEFIAVVPDLVSRGLIGVGAISLIVFLLLGGKRRPWYDIASYLVLVAMVIGSGVWLEARKIRVPETTPASERVRQPALACTDSNGRFGLVQIRLHVFNTDRSGHGYDQLGLPAAGEWLVSNSRVRDIQSNTSDFPNKRWGARWDCVAGPN
jgi:hypothetical protein